MPLRRSGAQAAARGSGADVLGAFCTPTCLLAVLVELRATEQEIKQFEQTRRRQLEEQGRRMRKAIVDDIDEVIERFASDRSLFAVIDSSGPSLNQVPVFLYSDPSSDITVAIVALLNVGQDQEDDWEEGVAEDEEEKESSLEIRD